MHGLAFLAAASLAFIEISEPISANSHSSSGRGPKGHDGLDERAC